MKREYCIKITTLLVFLVVFLPGVAAAQEASLYFSPSSGTFTAGTTFPVAVRVNTSGSAINAAQGILVFDPKKFTVVSTSKTNSIFALWTQEPTFSNSAGTLEFGGGVPSPGFSGAAGTIFTITFRARTAGDGTVTFSSGSILANDGRGTNILSFLGSGTYTIIPSTLPLPPEEGSLKPSLPNVSSLTHPSQDAWYSNNAPEFVWDLPSDVTAISYDLDREELTNPAFITQELALNKAYGDIAEGVWYFHVNFRNGFGWGPIAHRKVQIDTTPPNPFEIEVDRKGDPTNPTPTLIFNARDELSGVDHYEVQVDGEEPVSVAGSPYVLPSQSPGEHTVLVLAFDKAGNSRSSSVSVEVERPVVGGMFAFPKLGSLTVDVFAMLAVLLLLLFFFLAVALYAWYRFLRWRSKLRQETVEAERVLHKAFDALYEDLKQQFELLEEARRSRKLTKAEEEVQRVITKNLSIAEKFIGKEVKDIERELE